MTELERLVHENAQLTRQVTDIQRRCTELLEEKRRANVDYAAREFHLKFGHPAPGQLTVPDEAMIRFRLKLVAEEFLELVEATFKQAPLRGTPVHALELIRLQLARIIESSPIDLDLPEFMDATHDLDYVVAGTRVVFGYDGAPGAAEVHKSNMSKIPNGLGKPTKPEGWTPPDIAGVLKAQGWVRLESDAGARIEYFMHDMNKPPSNSFTDPDAKRVAPYAPPTDVKLEMPSDRCGRPGCTGSKVCEEEGCEALHPNACSADPSVDGWRCPKHARGATFEQEIKNAERDGAAGGRLMQILYNRPRFFQEAAKGLRKLAAKYPEMPADGECGEISRGYYETMAETLEGLVKP